MKKENEEQPATSSPPIFIVSGGVGASGGQLAQTALAQFQEVDLPVIIVPHMHEVAQIEAAVKQAVVGLTIQPGQLAVHHQQRQRRLGIPGGSAYTDPVELYEELQAARKC